MYKEAYDSTHGVSHIMGLYWDKLTADLLLAKGWPGLQLVELKEAEQQSLKESERLEKEIVEVRELKSKISTMTADEYFEKHPELKKKFDDEIRNDYWGY
ncbi:hypothetical protein IFM89_020418 [Coptis chinensis]|uniref:ATP synthase subunit d, mitochondrial n=1 Tax=Coptis chinensis TaxID=261450 RepID=A0A835HNH4_9MAGN|nr:hypothetical protein IFM89_020418 [Coptis chinensis]